MWVNMGEVEENMFMNEYSHTIDSKGRMILPTKFREELGNVFILAPGLDQCLCIYPKEKWGSLIAKLQKLPFTNQKVRKIMRHLIGRGTEVSCDRQGRILIPSHLREFAQLKKDVCIIGTGAIIEIWDPELLDADENGEESVAEIADSLDLPLNFDL